MARAEGTFRVQGPPRLDDASSWSNYKKRLASWKSCKMSEMHMGALVAMSMTSEVLVNIVVGSMVESQPGTVEVAFPNSGAAAMRGREQG